MRKGNGYNLDLMDGKKTKLNIIKKYWLNTPEFFSEKYENSFIQSLSPVNAFLTARRKKVLKLAGNVKNKKILDVGCGSGIFMLDFTKQGATVTGVDYSQKMLDLAGRELKSHRIARNKYSLKKASATMLPFKEKSFDIILATGLTDYLTDGENKKFIKEAARVLKKEGKFIVSFPVEKSPFSFVRSGIGLKIRRKLFKLPPIHNQFSLPKIYKMLKEVGLEENDHHKIFTTMWLIVAQFK